MAYKKRKKSTRRRSYNSGYSSRNRSYNRRGNSSRYKPRKRSSRRTVQTLRIVVEQPQTTSSMPLAQATPARKAMF